MTASGAPRESARKRRSRASWSSTRRAIATTRLALSIGLSRRAPLGVRDEAKHHAIEAFGLHADAGDARVHADGLQRLRNRLGLVRHGLLDALVPALHDDTRRTAT